MHPMLSGSMFKLVSVAAPGLVAIGLGLGGCASFDQNKPAAQSDAASATKELQIKPILQTTTGLSGKTFTYPEGEAELRLLRVEFPVGGSVPLHTHPAPLIAYVSQGQIRHTRGDQVNTFGPGQAFVESDQGGPHTVENIGEEPAVVFVAVASKQGLPTTNFVTSAP
ncbi:MAG TPA: cupin domain-containing protein [Synechococcales bacterium UBA12195]|nr:MAG: cupin domain-containing protein [Synechococcus sp. MED-G67]HCA60933.1 cupin domain-containing protein [Synechococcales bacterium UBA8647]HCV57724.1 cupin domain-containing protein [Synechococcales bacterium UBA12195]